METLAYRRSRSHGLPEEPRYIQKAALYNQFSNPFGVAQRDGEIHVIAPGVRAIGCPTPEVLMAFQSSVAVGPKP